METLELEVIEKGVETLPETFTSHLPPLYTNKEPLESHFQNILDKVCQYAPLPVEWTPIPERPPVFSIFNPTHVVKKHQVGKEKSTRGHIWMDVDPLAILFNKYRFRTCHTLDNVGVRYRAGNFVHVYNPFMGSLFAHATSPLHTELQAASSPYSGNGVMLGKNPVKIRPHQAIANMYFMRDGRNRPFFFLARLYDSCLAEYPWAASILQYVKIRCARYGVGLAVGKTWGKYYTAKGKEELIQTESIPLHTPAFSLPFKENENPGVLDVYGDDDLKFLYDPEGQTFECSVDGLLVLTPTLKSDVTIGLGPLWDQKKRGECYVILGNSRRYPCSHCHQPIQEGREHRNQAGDRFCQRCYNSLYFACSGCRNEFAKADAKTANRHSGAYCATCFQKLFKECETCHEHADRKLFEVIHAKVGGKKKSISACSDCRQKSKLRCTGCFDSFSVIPIPPRKTIYQGWKCESCGEQNG